MNGKNFDIPLFVPFARAQKSARYRGGGRIYELNNCSRG
jgi:hypothetical protein